MRTALLLALLLASSATAALLVPAASAQVLTEAPSTTILEMRPLDGTLEPGTPTFTKAVVRYKYMALGMVAMHSTKVKLDVVDAPPWAVVTVSPPAVHFDVNPYAHPSTTQEAIPQDVTVVISLNENAQPGAVASVRIVAVAERNAPIAPSSGEDALLLQVASSEECHHEDLAEAPVELEESSADEVTTASLGGSPVGLVSTGTVAVLGLAGAGAGVAYARRRR